MPVPTTQEMPTAFQQPFISLSGGVRVVLWKSILGRGLSSSSDWLKISVMANRPIISAVDEIPACSCQNPKVRRDTPLMESMPMEPSIRPNTAPSMPLSRESEHMETTTDRPISATAKYSQLPKLRDTLANCGAIAISAKAENVPPMSEQNTPMASACAGLPCLVMG